MPSPTASAAATVPSERTQNAVAGHSIALPPGFAITVFAEDLGAPRFMALDDDGNLYVTDSNGRVLRLSDADGDGVSDAATVVLDGLNHPHGITFHDGVLYVAETDRVDRVDDSDGDGVPDTAVPIIENLPTGGHSTRTIRFGSDGRLYVSIGSSCNVCEEDDPRRAAISVYNADGSGGEVYASGLRNAVGIAFQPDSSELWATNNGRDGLGDDVPPETVNQVNQGDDFGWPRCHSGDIPDPDFAGETGCQGVAQPAVKMQAHSAPLGLAFYDADTFGPAYAGGLFVAFHGSWNRSVPTGYKIVFLPFEKGRPTGDVIDFATGWLTDQGDVWGRPVDVLVAPDGSLFVSDDEGGRIFRILRVP